jgi:hypothetical protein
VLSGLGPLNRHLRKERDLMKIKALLSFFWPLSILTYGLEVSSCDPIHSLGEAILKTSSVALDTKAEDAINSINQFYNLARSEEFERLRKEPIEKASQEGFPFFYQQAQKLLLLCTLDDSNKNTHLAKSKESFANDFKKYEGKMSYQSFFRLCCYVAFLNDHKSDEIAYDAVSQEVNNLRRIVETTGYDYVSFYNKLPMNVDLLPTYGCCSRFYPLILVGNNRFQQESYFYALSKRIHLTSLPLQNSEELHGGTYKGVAAILFHDFAHDAQIRSFRKGILPFFVQEFLEKGIAQRKYDIYESLGDYFYKLLQTLNPQSPEYKKVREVGYNLTHESWTDHDTFRAESVTVQDYLKDLIACLKITLETQLLPDSLMSQEAFEAILPKSIELKNQLERGKGKGSRIIRRPTDIHHAEPETVKLINLEDVRFEILHKQKQKQGIEIEYVMHIPQGNGVESIKKNITVDVDYCQAPESRSKKNLVVSGARARERALK